MAVPLAVRYEIEELLAEYAAVLDAADLEQWPEFFTEQCFYEIIPRENYGSLVISGVPNYLIFQANKAYPDRSR